MHCTNFINSYPTNIDAERNVKVLTEMCSVAFARDHEFYTFKRVSIQCMLISIGNEAMRGSFSVQILLSLRAEIVA